MFDTLSKNFVPRILFTLVIALITMESTAQINPVAVTTVSAASYERAPVAPESLVSAFGTSLSTATVVASDQNPQTPVIDLPTTLGGTRVQVNGVLAGILFVSPLQVNFVIPAGITAGTATVKILASDGTESNGTLEVGAFRPSLFTFNANGQGVLAAEVVRVKANGTQSRETLATIDAVTNRYETKPIDLGPQGERVFLEIYLTGIRGSQDSNNDGNLKENVWVLVGGNLLLPEYAGRQPIFAGLDQVNVELPRSLIGAGKINLVMHERLGNCTACLSQPGVSSQIVELEIASVTSATPPRITSLSAASVSVGNTLFINGDGFASNPKDNVVRIGGTRAKVQFANATQLTVPVPVGAKTGIVTVNTTQGEARSSTELAVKTSIRGRVETGDPMNPLQPVPLANIKVSIVGTDKTTVTNLQGVFSFQDAIAGNVELEFDPVTFPVQGLFTKVTMPMTIIAGRDNALPHSIWLTANGILSDAQTNTGAVIVGSFLADDGSPVANADIRLTGQRNYSAVTDGNGAYVFRNVSVGTYVMSAGVQRPEGIIARVIQDLEIVEPNMPVVRNSNLLSQETNRPPILFTPKNVTMFVTETREVPIYAADPNIGQGLTVAVTGPLGTSILSGTNGAFTIRLAPLSPGVSNIAVKVTDVFGAEVMQNIELTINALVNRIAPTLTVPNGQVIYDGQALTFNVSFSDPDVGQTVTLDVAGIPQGASFVPNNAMSPSGGTFTWTPTAAQVGSHTLTFVATDNGTPALKTTKTVSILVRSQEERWTRVGNGGLPEGKYIEWPVAKGANLWGMISGGGAFVSSDGGNTWRAKNNGLTNLNLISIGVIGTRLFATTATNLPDSSSVLSGIYISDDEGDSWRQTNPNLAALNLQQLRIDQGKMYAINPSSVGASFWVSTDYGATWEKLSIDPRTSPFQMVVARGNVFVLPSGFAVFHWNGLNWVERKIGAVTIANQYRFLATDGENVHVVRGNNSVDIYSNGWGSGGAGLPVGNATGGQILGLFFGSGVVIALHPSQQMFLSSNQGGSYGYLGEAPGAVDGYPSILSVAFVERFAYAATVKGIYKRKLP